MGDRFEVGVENRRGVVAKPFPLELRPGVTGVCRPQHQPSYDEKVNHHDERKLTCRCGEGDCGGEVDMMKLN